MSLSENAPLCAACEALVVPATDPLSILRRLPERLFNLAVRVSPEEAIFDDVFFDESRFGPIPGFDPTPQYELARVFAQEKDAFVLFWRQAVALQHGMGILTVDGEGVVSGQCPRAQGDDLDRVGLQYGVGRPRGFTDCCYWRLVTLLLFVPGATRWQISELCQLYTGIRPKITEEPAKLILTWPTGGGVSFFDDRTDDAEPGGWFLDQDAYLDGDVAIAGLAEKYHGYLQSGAEEAGDVPTYLGDASTQGGGLSGLTLAQAIARAKAAGVAVVLDSLPPSGIAGCYGATERRQQSGFVLA